MTREREFDIRANADDVARLMQEGDVAAGLRLLEERRAGQPLVVQEALDRYVIGAAGEQVRAAAVEVRGAGLGGALDRVIAASAPPRLPDHDVEVHPLPETQRYDIYASIARLRGGEAAERALSTNNERAILGLRRETDTRASATRADPMRRQEDDAETPRDESSRGTGVYDDGLVVLWTDNAGHRRMEFARASTEPTAQYDEHAARHQSGYENVRFRRREGDDVNGDGIRDLGRLAEGVFEMQAARHPNPGASGTHDALPKGTEAVKSS